MLTKPMSDYCNDFHANSLILALCNDCNEGYKNRCSYEQIQVLSGKSKKDSEICLLLDRSIEIDDLYLGKRKKNKLLLFLAF